MRYTLTVLSLSILSISTGCTTLATGKSNSKDAWSITKLWKKEYQIPQKMVTIWTHDVLASAHAAPTRGFGGRVYFYNEKSQPIPVEGELVVHGFEEKPGVLREYTTQSDKRFRFTPEQFTAHYSESDLGASYSVWIPWDGVDGARKEITLIPTFRAGNGQLVQGAASKLVLPGKELPGMGPMPTGVQPVAFQQSVKSPESTTNTTESGASTGGGMTTTTINVSSSASQRLLSPSTVSTVPSTTIQSTVQPMTNPEAHAKVDAILEQLRRINSQPVTTNASAGSNGAVDNTTPSTASSPNVHNLTPPAQNRRPQQSTAGFDTPHGIQRGF